MIEFASGTTVKLSWSHPDYSAAAGWSATLVFRNKDGGLSVNGTPVGDAFDFILTPASNTLAAGEYKYQISVTKGANRFIAESGDALVHPDLNAAGTFDDRSPTKRILDAIDALLEGRIPDDVDSYTIGTRSLRHLSIMELTELRKVYAKRYAAEEQAKRGFRIAQSRLLLNRYA